MPPILLPLKLRMPSLRQDYVSRPHLVAQLGQIWRSEKRLALVCAPAGYGKTSSIVEWLSSINDEAEDLSACPDVAWLSLDDTDNNLTHSLIYLIEALKNALPSEQYQDCRAACDLLEGSQSVSTQGVLTVLLASLSEFSRAIVLAFDDYHVITNPAIHESVKFLLANLPPKMRVLLITRVDPPLGLAQMRARNQMVEIRTADLQFTIPETTEFLTHTMGLPLTQEQIAVLASRTEGWAAGLQMAALSLQGRNDPDSFIQAFSGSHRFILEYLMEEVLNRQPPAVQEFLLRTSIFERLCTKSCDYLLERPNTSQDMLHLLERMNLFLVPQDDEGGWYRYHPLFTSLLRNRLRQTVDASGVQELYCRASRWFESQGLLAEAISQALGAPDLTYAADLLDREVLTFFYQSEITQVHRWLETLPEPMLLQRPLLCAVYAASIALVMPYPPKSLPAAEKWMQTAERALSQEPGSINLVHAFIFTIRSYWSRFRSESPDTVRRFITSALSLLPGEPGAPEDRNLLFIRSALQTNLGLVYWDMGDELAARLAFTQARDIGLACGDLFNATASINVLVRIAYFHGQPVEAIALCREALRYFDSQQAHLGHRVPFSAEIGVQLAEILIEQDHLDEAERNLVENIELAKWTTSCNILVKGYLAFARLAISHADPTQAFEYLGECEKLSKEGAELAAAHRIRLWLALCDQKPEFLDLARQWAQNRSLCEFGRQPHLVEWSNSLALMRLIVKEQNLLQMERANAVPADTEKLLGWIERQGRAMHTRGWMHWEIQLLLLEWLTRHSTGDKKGALVALRRALDIAAPGGYVRTFVEEGEPLRLLLAEMEKDAGRMTAYIRTLLSASPKAPARITQPDNPAKGPGEELVEPLTEREAVVLELISQGLSNQEIAAKLVVTINTVKKHNNSIFGKLGVANRAQAIVRARQLGLSN